MGIQDESANFSKRQAQKVFSFTYRVTKDLIDAPVNAALKPLTEVFKKIIGFLAKLPIKAIGLTGKGVFKAGKYALVEGVVRNITEGKTKLKNLVEKGNTDYVDISNREEFALLKKYCKKYHVEYAVLRSKTDPEQHTIFFKASDANIIQKLLDQVVQEMEQKQRKDQERNENIEQNISQDKEQERNENIEQDIKQDSEERSSSNDGAREQKKERSNMSGDEREKEEPINDSPKSERPIQDATKQPEFTKENVEVKDTYQGGAYKDVDVDFTSNDIWEQELSKSFDRASTSKERLAKAIGIDSNERKKPVFTLNSMKLDRIAKNEREAKEKALNPLKDITKTDKRDSLAL